MRTGEFVRGIALTLAFATLALALTTCGGGKSAMNPPSIGYGGLQAADSLDSAFAELDALETPEGVDEALWIELKDALASLLTTSNERLPAKALATVGPTTSRLASVPPTGESNRVTDLAITDNGDDTFTLSWHYRNLGDYDQDGVVSIEDIIPLAVHFGESYDLADRNCLLAVIDGSGNGVIDIADITPIAINLNVDIAGYSVEGSNSATGSFSFLQSVPFSASVDYGRLGFSYDLNGLSWDYYSVVPYDSEGAAGMPGYVASLAPAVHSVSPLEGMQGSAVVFSADVTGLLPLAYAWNFAGGASLGISHYASPTATLRDPGVYLACLTVSNSAGEDTLEFVLQVLEGSPVTVSGRIVEREDEDVGVPGITVEIIGEDLPPGVTDNEGYYEITNVPVGDYTVKPTTSGWLFWPEKRWIYASEQDHGADFEALHTDWHIRIVDDSVASGSSSLAIVDGCPAVSCYERFFPSGSQLRFRRASDVDGLAWETDAVTVASSGLHQWTTGAFNSLAFISGAPAVSYNGSLNYCRALDPGGSEWDTVTVVAEDIEPRLMSLLAASGSPAIVYYDASLDRIEYVRASDGTGSVWGEPLTLCDSPASYSGMDFAIVDGNPAISYFDPAVGELVFRRAKDARGDRWNPAVVVGVGPHGCNTLLPAVNGYPAIVYQVDDFSSYAIKYVRAVDAQGTEWSEPVHVVGGGCFIGGPGVTAMCGDRPFVIWGINASLYFIESDDANGSEWGDRSIIDADWFGGDGYGGLSPATVNGHPAVSYISYARNELRYAVYIP